ncbi:HAD-IA family hydrolase [Micromonospora sp. C32]|uniref:HAD-IA family hydrolase n=1 Tax=unclassified Micromonospora TaxID=2617518 RepID=UPI001B36015E|nr:MULTISPECIES: HAD-IA family hydrolase [unclassified Micromonospora]MBQ1044358.1 HAD-IA family hydrolase [Micromonospora sp. C72]MBQ1056862.1 HAD-IA family hydrolase [Micromonospora sp. C32]
MSSLTVFDIGGTHVRWAQWSPQRGRSLAEARMAAAGLPVPPVVVSADDVTAGKPSPEGYLTAAQRLGVAPHRAVVFEDAEAGLLAARACGARTVVVGRCAAPVTSGLDRVADLRQVRVEPTPGGGLRLTYPT